MAVAQQPAVNTMNANLAQTIAVFFRIHPGSTIQVGGQSSMWISTLSSRSIEHLRNTAVEKYPGVICLGIEGIVKDGKGGELPLPVTDDVELETYLHHAQGAPIFQVQLASPASAWLSLKG